MGHERVGFLPKTKKWADLVRKMESVDSGNTPISAIAIQTLQNVRQQYETLFQDAAVKAIFSFLVTFSCAYRSKDPNGELKKSGINIPDQPNLLSFVKALREQVPPKNVTTEYGQLSLSAATDAIGLWYKQNATTQIPLFKPTEEYFETWRNLGTGSGFCELSRLFFSRLTERYLNYFLDRAASTAFSNVDQCNKFRHNLRTYVDDVSVHAFETAKITQSFAAGWFNAHARERIPNMKEIEGFLSIAFGKLREELRREEEK